jgi:tellurite resistance protein TehA-like permease
MLFLMVGIVGGLVLFAAVAVYYFKRVDEMPPPDMPPSIGHAVLIPTGVFRENEASTVLWG